MWSSDCMIVTHTLEWYRIHATEFDCDEPNYSGPCKETPGRPGPCGNTPGDLGHVGIPLVTWVTQSRTHYSVEFTKDTDY